MVGFSAAGFLRIKANFIIQHRHVGNALFPNSFKLQPTPWKLWFVAISEVHLSLGVLTLMNQ